MANCGGSAGHEGEYQLSVNQGPPALKGRIWDVSVQDTTLDGFEDLGEDLGEDMRAKIISLITMNPNCSTQFILDGRAGRHIDVRAELHAMEKEGLISIDTSGRANRHRWIEGPKMMIENRRFLPVPNPVPNPSRGGTGRHAGRT